MGRRLTMLAFCVSLLLVSCGQKVSKVSYSPEEGTVTIANIGHRYLWIPIEDKVSSVPVSVNIPEFETGVIFMQMAESQTDYYTAIDLKSKHADTLFLSLEMPARLEYFANNLKLSNSLPSISVKKSSVHFCPTSNWINDPNGMVYLDGEYHLFYQSNPVGAKWGNMTWGHAVSRDLISWIELAPALYPDCIGAIFSGCAVIDKDNTSGFGENSMVAIYTADGQSQVQCLAYSNDNGRTFTKYSSNPVLSSNNPDFRDPKVFWLESAQKWIMILAAGNAVELYSSINLKQWTFESRWGEDYGIHDGVWECPDLFPVSFEGQTKWVMLCSVSNYSDRGPTVQYFVGDFDGHKFTCDYEKSEIHLLNYGRDFYAAVTWSNVPGGKIVALPWFNNWQYANDIPLLGRRGQMGLPTELSLHRDMNGNVVLHLTPIQALDSAVSNSIVYNNISIDKLWNIKQDIPSGGTYSISFDFSDINAQLMVIKLFNDKGEYVDICVNSMDNTIMVDRQNSGRTDFSKKFPSVSTAPLEMRDGRLEMLLILGPYTIECFASGISISDLLFPEIPYNRISVYTIGGSAQANKIIINNYK